MLVRLTCDPKSTESTNVPLGTTEKEGVLRRVWKLLAVMKDASACVQMK